MPTSAQEGKDWLAKRYQDLNLSGVVVDVGAGSGTYSDLLRSEGDETFWIGYEIWAPYSAQFQLWEKYDALLLVDVREARLPHADLYIAGDVLEHMSKLDAEWLIGLMKLRANHIFVSLPIVHYPQGAVNGNPYEEHVHHWTHGEMLGTLAGGPGTVECSVGEVIGAYHWRRDSGS